MLNSLNLSFAEPRLLKLNINAIARFQRLTADLRYLLMFYHINKRVKHLQLLEVVIQYHNIF